MDPLFGPLNVFLHFYSDHVHMQLTSLNMAAVNPMPVRPALRSSGVEDKDVGVWKHLARRCQGVFSSAQY